MLCLQPYNLSSSFYRINYVVQSEDSRGYSRRIYIDPWDYLMPVPNYCTIERLTLGEVYNVTVRALVRPTSACYSQIYGEYSDPIYVETVETGKIQLLELLLT